jgi:N-acetylneuraminate synthase
VQDFHLGDRTFGYLNPYIIAEIGVNHEGSLERAKHLIEAAARGGAHAAKFQTYKAELLAAKTTSPAYWDQTKEATSSQYELFQRWDNFGDSEYEALAQTCKDVGIDFMSTPFDFEAANALAPLMPAIKVASADITNVPLIRLVASKGKPVIISTGAATLDEVRTAVEIASAAGAKEITLLHCILNYPTSLENAQLAQIDALKAEFGDRCAIGYSDHVTPEPDGDVPALLTATILGSVVLEKHFTDDKAATGNDHYHAVDEVDLLRFTTNLARIRAGYGNGVRDLSGQQAAINNARRRVIIKSSKPAGYVIQAEDLIPLRSNVGIEIAHWDSVVGRTLAVDVEAELPLEWSQLA